MFRVGGFGRIAAAAIGMFCLAWPANAAIVGVVNVDLTNSLGTDSSFTLENGVEYLLSVEGLADIGVETDAEYWTQDGFATQNDSHKGIDIGLALNGVGIDWGPFRFDHAYTATIMGAGSVINLSFLDVFYSDNRGIFAVTVSDVGEVLVNPIPGAGVLFGTAAIVAGAWRSRRKKTSTA